MQKHDETWKKDPEAKIKRVFRTTKVPFEQEKRQIGTVNRQEGTVSGTTVRPMTLWKKVNHAGQYILQENEQEYDVQLKALRREVAKGRILEVDPVWDGRPFVPKPPPDEKDKRIKELEAELAARDAVDDTPETPEPPVEPLKDDKQGGKGKGGNGPASSQPHEGGK